MLTFLNRRNLDLSLPLKKTLQLLTQYKYPDLESQFTLSIAANQYTRFTENRFMFHDFLIKPKYKEIVFNGEFGQELLYALPFAYWHYLNGTLSKTVSSHDMKEFYFFSDSHEEQFAKRRWNGWSYTYGIPNMLHTDNISYQKWQQVPLKEFYANDIFRFEKPIMVIANKYNIEWKKSPVNYLDKETLQSIFQKFKHKYQIIYNRPGPKSIVNDNSDILDLKEHSWIRENHPEVLLMDDIFEKNQHRINNFNHLQLMVYSNSEHFVSVQGGAAVLASYFGGTNIIYSKMGNEHYFNEYETFYPNLSNAKILHAQTRIEALTYINEYF